MITNNFTQRQIGPSLEDVEKMLNVVGFRSLSDFIDKVVPPHIRYDYEKTLDLPKGKSEAEVYELLKTLGSKNKLYRSFIGMGYYNTITPPVILRNILENPGWYTSYTPYQAEISQGRLEALLVFQTMISDLTQMPVSNCSLLDEAGACAEAMIMAFNSRSRELIKRNANVFLVSSSMFPQTIELVAAKAEPLGIEVKIGNWENFQFDEKVFGVIVQYPDDKGEIYDYSSLVTKAHNVGARVAVAVDLMSLVLLTPPGEWGVDIVVGSDQRFGIPMGYGGPNSGFLACKDELIRFVPGRIIGVSIDSDNKPALRMTLQTREQHIKREKATSNICTAQALIAMMSAMYAVYHGPNGLKEIVKNINVISGALAQEIEKYGYKQLNNNFFDTIRIELPENVDIDNIRKLALQSKMNFYYVNNKIVSISVDETTSVNDINNILRVFATANNKTFSEFTSEEEFCQKIETFAQKFVRTTKFLTHKIFNSYHSEIDMMRYIKSLEIRDLSLNRSMIPLGSCSMKLTPAVSMFHLSWPEFINLHPFVPIDQAEGYWELIDDMDKILSEVTGFKKMSFQPNSGAAGEYAGLMVIREYHKRNGQRHRNVCLLPSSSHGTNPASAVMAGMNTVIVKSDEKGNVDVEDLRIKARQHKDNLFCIMITYPSTHGIFEEEIKTIIDIVHENGGQVYMDGANMNAQVGITSPGFLDADVCHINLHKTFGSPHGGGGPGAGPIAVAEHLVEFLPGHPVIKVGGKNAIRAIAATPFGNTAVLPITYAYLKLLGGEGMTYTTKMAMLTVNYVKAKLEKYYKILYVGKNGLVAHEMLIDINPFTKTVNLNSTDIAKRLIDYGIHAPTVSFPVVGTLMFEPTESEPLRELDRFIEAMISIRNEIKEIEEGKADKENNVIKNAPHTLDKLIALEWKYPYSKQKAFMPVDMPDKYFAPVGRVDNLYGDRNLVCTLPPVE